MDYKSSLFYSYAMSNNQRGESDFVRKKDEVNLVEIVANVTEPLPRQEKSRE